MRITFLGAAGTVTGSNFLITNERDESALVDMGMFQGTPETESLNTEQIRFDAKKVHSVLLTHAHLDHCGRLPMLISQGFKGKVYMTAATKKLIEIVLEDSANIFERENRARLYTLNDVTKLINKAEIVKYDSQFEIPEYDVLYKNAGHILGSASIKLTNKNTHKSIIFSGDLGNTPEDIVEPTEYFDSGDYVVMESTYGDRTHPEENPKDIINKEINLIEESGGTLLIPSFSIERTQEILHIIDHLKESASVKPETKVFLDSPMGEKATDVYLAFRELYNQELKTHSRNDNPFSFPGFKSVDSAQESKRIVSISGPKVIISGSGMMNGGRIVNHAITFLPKDTTRLLIVGFQAEGTPGRALEEGEKSIELYGQKVQVRGSINAVHSMSSHADQPRLLNWVSNIKGIKTLYLVHGEDDARKELMNKILENKFTDEVKLPYIYEAFNMI